MDWHPDQLREQGLGEAADLWMTRYRRRKRAAIAVNRVSIITQFQFCHATELIENVYSHLEPRTQISRRHIPLGSDAPPHHAQQGFHFMSRHVLVEDMQKFAQHRSICFRE